MVFARASAATSSLGRTVLRRTGASARSRAWRHVPRRTYASGHGEQQSSELPWIIGSLVVTIPAAGFLIQQGGSSGGHGHGHDEHPKEEHSSEDESDSAEKPEEDDSDGDDKNTADDEAEAQDKPQKGDDSKDDGKDNGNDKKSKDDGKDKSKSKDKPNDTGKDSSDKDSGDKGTKKETTSPTKKGQTSSDDDQYEMPGPNAPQQINWKPGMNKGPGEGQKGERAPTEKKGEKMAQGDSSGAKHPYIDDPEKSKKGLGVTETARIHGTVDPRAPARGVGQSGEGSKSDSNQSA